MGFFDSKSSTSSFDQKTDNSANQGGNNVGAGVTNPALSDNGSVSVAGANVTGDLSIESSDFGAIEAGEAIATQALKSNERTFDDLADTLEDVTSQAIDANQDTTDRALDFAEDTTSRVLSENTSVVLSALDSSQDLFEVAISSNNEQSATLARSLTGFGQDVASANRSDGKELLKTLGPVLKWGAVGIIGSLAFRILKA